MPGKPDALKRNTPTPAGTWPANFGWNAQNNPFWPAALTTPFHQQMNQMFTEALHRMPLMSQFWGLPNTGINITETDGHFEIRTEVPEGLGLDQAEFSLEDNVLTITIPKDAAEAENEDEKKEPPKPHHPPHHGKHGKHHPSGKERH